MPPPVFFCSIESEDHHENQKLSEILYNMSLEDPSLTVKENEETGQVLVSGLGELHLEILQDRILKEFKIKTELGPMRVAYRECVSDEI
jgi:elongation factor G